MRIRNIVLKCIKLHLNKKRITANTNGFLRNAELANHPKPLQGNNDILTLTRKKYIFYILPLSVPISFVISLILSLSLSLSVSLSISVSLSLFRSLFLSLFGFLSLSYHYLSIYICSQQSSKLRQTRAGSEPRIKVSVYNRQQKPNSTLCSYSPVNIKPTKTFFLNYSFGQ